MNSRLPKIDVRQIEGRLYQITIVDPQYLQQIQKWNQQLIRLGLTHINILKPFKNRGKYQSVKFSFQQNLKNQKQFTVSIHKSKCTNKNLVILCHQLYQIWNSMLKVLKINIGFINAENNRNQGPKIQIVSIDVLSLQFSIAQPQYYNKKVYFRYSDLQFNCNIPSLDKIDKYTQPHLFFSFVPDDYYKSPRLLYLDQFAMTKFQQSLKNLKQNFMIGLTLFNMHFYLNILEEQQKKILNQFSKMKIEYQKQKQPKLIEQYRRMSRQFQYPLYKNLNLIKQQFHRKICMSSVLSSLGRMNRFKIVLQHQQKQRQKQKQKEKQFSQFSIIVLAEKNIINVRVIQGLVERKDICQKYVQRYKTMIEGLAFIDRQTPRQTKIEYTYKNRACFQFFMISFQLYCFAVLDREWKVKYNNGEIIVEVRGEEVQVKYNKNLVISLVIGKQQKLLSFVYLCKHIKVQNQQKNQKTTAMFSSYINNCLRIWNIRDFIKQICQMCDLFSKYQLSKQQQQILKKVLNESQLSISKKICRVTYKKQGQDIIITLIIYDVKMAPMINAKIKYELSKDKQKVMMEISKDRRPNIATIPNRKEEKLKDFLQGYKIEKSLTT